MKLASIGLMYGCGRLQTHKTVCFMIPYRFPVYVRLK